MDYLHRVYDYEIEDLTDDAAAQADGIDFAVTKNGQRSTIEFKYDTQIHRTRNLALEIISNLTRRRIGCGLSSKADYLLYYDPVNQLCHKLKLQELVLAIEESPLVKWSVGKATTPIGKDKGYSSLSLLVPLDFLLAVRERIAYQTLDLQHFSQKIA